MLRSSRVVEGLQRERGVGRSFNKRKWDIWWFRVQETTLTEVLEERRYCGFGGFGSCRNVPCTIHCPRANITIVTNNMRSYQVPGKQKGGVNEINRWEIKTIRQKKKKQVDVYYSIWGVCPARRGICHVIEASHANSGRAVGYFTARNYQPQQARPPEQPQRDFRRPLE